MVRKILYLVVSFLVFVATVQAQQDSVDALHYDLKLDIGNHTTKRIEGSATVTLRILRQVDSLALELCPSDIDSVTIDGTAVGYDYSSADWLLRVPYSGNAGDTVNMTVYYSKGQSIMPQGWGGFYFDDDIYYNLGIALYKYPHNIGKSWFPCRDNFHDKAKYHFAITAKPGWKTICTGMQDSVVYNSDNSSTWYWSLQRLTPTYLVGVAVAPFRIIEREYVGEYSTYPAILGFLGHDSINVWRAFDNLSKVIPMYERCFGPYLWDRVGYVSTPKGSMEHSSSISFTTYCMASQDEACLATMCHEFAHSWFGNLVTCANSEDMWINEGGASFCEEVAIEALTADTAPLYYRQFARRNLIDVLMNTHITDGGFKALYGQTPQYTYGSTVYDKGATVWHSMRGYLGDSLFYASLRKLFDRAAFKNLDSWQLRDSLSQYSGVDLTEFFDFHVFSPGFVDYVIDSIHVSRSSTAVFIRQKTYGVDTFANGNRVWVTFFSPEMRTARRLVSFDGEKTKAVFQLPFKPQFAVLNLEEEISMASVAQQVTLNNSGTRVLDDVFFKTSPRTLTEGDSIWLHVAHHWTNPDTSLSPRFIKMADRFWTVSGSIPDGCKASGQFYYSNLGSDKTLDDNLFTSSEFGQLRLLYRARAGEEWRVVSDVTTGNNRQGYFSMYTLKLGEYTLALVDTSFMGIAVPEQNGTAPMRVFPNPTSKSLTIETDVVGEQMSVDICDLGGREIRNGIEVRSGERFELDLPTGNYLLKIKRPYIKDFVGVKIQVRNF